jgi:hypothetical protein
MAQILVDRRAILRSPWTQAIFLGCAFVGYHFLMAAINPRTGVIEPAAFPLYAMVDPVLNVWVIAPILTFAGWLMTLAWFWRRRSQAVPILIAVAFVVALNVTTAMVRGGVPALWGPFTRIQPEAKLEYFADIDRVNSNPVAFVRNYRKLVPTLSAHATTHPPGPILYLWAMSRVFGQGIAAAAWAAIIGTALSIYPFSLLARTVLSPAASRYAIAMYAVTPALVLFGATSMDGVSVFFSLLATYFFHKSWSQNPVRYSILTGVVLAAAMFFTYMTVCIGFVFALEAVLASRSPRASRIWRNLVYAGLTFAFVYWLLFLLTNYNVIRAFDLARQVASGYRLELYPDLWHYLSVSVANLAAFLIGVGVITVTLWWREAAEGWLAWRARRPTDLLSIALSAAVVLLAFATIFCVETERVWLFLAPLPVLAAARHLDRLQTANPRSPAWCVVLTLLFTQALATELFLNTLW